MLFSHFFYFVFVCKKPLTSANEVVNGVGDFEKLLLLWFMHGYSISETQSLQEQNQSPFHHNKIKHCLTVSCPLVLFVLLIGSVQHNNSLSAVFILET